MIRRRTYISIIFTILMLIFTSEFWLNCNPIPVEFDIIGKGKIRIEVQLNNDDNVEFKKYNSSSKEVNLNSDKIVKIDVKSSIRPKRIRIVFEDFDYNNFIIKNIKLRGDKNKLTDLKLFSCENADLKIVNGALYISPKNSNKFILNYDSSLNVRCSVKLEFGLFVIIAILSFLLIFKLCDYIADFKTIKHNSRIEIFFLVIFFMFLFVPISKINEDDISVKENRTLSKLEPLITDGHKVNYKFGKVFNEWFNDHFYLRNYFINLYDNRLKLQRNWLTENVINGKDGWLFLGWQDAIDSYTNNGLFTNEEIINIFNYLNEVNNYCKKNNKKFYLIIAPDKSKIYEEFYTDCIKKTLNESKAEQLIKYIQEHSDIKVVYPKEILISVKNDGLLYWKTDTHWNNLGAYYGYLNLINIIKKDFKAINIYKISNYTREKHDGDLYVMSPEVLRKSDSTLYKIPKNENNKTICNTPEELRGVVECYNEDGTKNLLMFRDSFSNSLIPYLSYSFKNSKYVWQYNVTPKMMEDADIIVLEIVERSLSTLINNYME